MTYFYETKTRATLLDQVFAQESRVYPNLPTEWQRNQVTISSWKRKRGDYLLEAHRPPQLPKRWTLNRYTKELIPWD